MAVETTRYALLSLVLLLAFNPALSQEEAQTVPPAGFWAYYLEYGTQNGDVFDPNDLEDVTRLINHENDKDPDASGQKTPDTEDD